MKFTLTYEGELRADDNYRRKWDIRKQIHPQLEELWETAPSLRTLERVHRYIPLSGYFIMEGHHSMDAGLPTPANQQEGRTDLGAPIGVGGRFFRPLVRESYALRCALKITFLRKEEPGRVFQGGDMDNRLKTLFDALSVPNKDQIVDDDTISDPIYCLLEDDSLISRLDVDTHRLFGVPEASKHHVKLIIEVDVRVVQARMYNQPFLGD